MEGLVSSPFVSQDSTDWITVPELAKLMDVTLQAIQMGITRGKYTQVRKIDGSGHGQGGKIWLINIHDPKIPSHAKLAYLQQKITGDKGLSKDVITPDKELSNPANPRCSSFCESGRDSFTRPDLPTSPAQEYDVEAEILSRAPAWARDKAHKILAVLEASKGMIGRELKAFVAEWNAKHPGRTISYSRVLEWRKIHDEQGITGLLPQYGKNSGKTSVKDDWFFYFRDRYLKEGGSSSRSCWLGTFGYARERNHSLDDRSFPSEAAFLRRLEREIPASSIYLQRFGFERWKRKYGSYIDRDYSNISAGEVWVGDHAQVDVAVKLPNGKPCFPWVTAWRCFKTGRWLGWHHHSEAPNSDHIFQSFYYAAKDYGLPDDLIIDNGKDYRVRDFAGGRTTCKAAIDEEKTVAMTSILGIKTHFALAYNAQTKPIERDFLKSKEWFSKNMPGYRGGNTKERPEALKEEIRKGKILSWEEYTKFMDLFITNVLDNMPSQGKNLKGLSPMQAWEKENPLLKRISVDSLKLFCMRTSKPLTVGRNGAKDSEVDLTYYAEWMSPLKGSKVYLVPIRKPKLLEISRK
jgi:hypothetical protein